MFNAILKSNRNNRNIWLVIKCKFAKHQFDLLYFRLSLNEPIKQVLKIINATKNIERIDGRRAKRNRG